MRRWSVTVTARGVMALAGLGLLLLPRPWDYVGMGLIALSLIWRWVGDWRA